MQTPGDNPRPQTEWREQLHVEGTRLAERIEALIHEGNVRHLILKHDGHTLLEIPVTAGVAVALLAPVVAAVAALGAALTHCTVEVVRTEGSG